MARVSGRRWLARDGCSVLERCARGLRLQWVLSDFGAIGSDLSNGCRLTVCHCLVLLFPTPVLFTCLSPL